MPGTCPVCGGSESRLLAPGFHECCSRVMVDAAPPGLGGNMGFVPIPIYDRCGHRYQTSPRETMTETCACGMFAVGLCSTCGRPRCGEHSGFLGGKFVCSAHVFEANQEEAKQAAEEKRRLIDAATQQSQERERREQQRYEQLAPGFPDGACSGPDMSAALTRLVPSHPSTYILGYQRISPKINYRHWGPAIPIEGWGFETGRQSLETEGCVTGHHGLGLIITLDGICYRTKDLNVRDDERIPRPKITREMYDERERMSDDWLIPVEDVQAIREQVLVWRDAPAQSDQ